MVKTKWTGQVRDEFMVLNLSYFPVTTNIHIEMHKHIYKYLYV